MIPGSLALRCPSQLLNVFMSIEAVALSGTGHQIVLKVAARSQTRRVDEYRQMNALGNRHILDRRCEDRIPR